jgi:antitoxin VapB
MTQAIVDALEAELARERAARPLAARLLAMAADLQASAGPNRRPLTKDEIDALWGQ